MNAAILACQKYLHPDKPAKVTSKDVKEKLVKLGWTEGDPIPSGLPTYTKEVLKTLGKSSTTKNALELFDLEEVQVTLISALKHTKMVDNKESAVQDKMKEILPDLNTVVPAARAPLQEIARMKAEKEIVTEAENFGQPVEETDEFEEVAETPEPESVVPTPEQDAINQGKYPTPTICPICGFDLKSVYTAPTISEEDKDLFLYTILGSGRFHKRYKALNGKMVVTFKALTAAEVEAINQQVRTDIFNKELSSEAQQTARQYLYTIACAVYAIEYPGSNLPDAPILPLSTNKFLDKGEPSIKKYTKYMLETVFCSEVKYGLIRHLYDQFLLYYAQLRKEVNNPNFWNGPSGNG